MAFQAGAVIGVLSAKISGFTKKMNKARQSYSAFAKHIEKLNNSKIAKTLRTFNSNINRHINNALEKSLSIARTTMLGIGTAVLGIGGVALKTAASYETMRVALNTTFQGNQKASEAAFSSVKEFASKTPFQLDQVLEGFIKLKNLGLSPSQRALTAYGDTASAMGKSLNQMVEAVADASTFEFERLKEFGIRASQEKDKVTFTFRGVKTTVAKDAKEIENFLIGLGETNFAGGMQQQSQTLAGLFSTAKDTIFLTLDELARNSGLLDLAKNVIIQITTALANNQDNIQTFVDNFKSFIGQIRLLVEEYWPKIEPFIDSFVSFIANNQEHIIRIAKAIGIFVATMWLLNAAFTVFAFVTSPITLITVGIIALVAAVLWLWDNWSWVFPKIKEFAQNTFNWIKDNYPFLTAFIIEPFEIAISAITEHWDSIVAVSEKGWTLIKDAAKAQIDIIANALDPIFDTIEALEKGFKKVTKKIPSIKDFKLPGFAEGGIVGGSSLTGDRLLARVNSREMILNQRQQAKLFDMINSASNTTNNNKNITINQYGNNLNTQFVPTYGF